MWGRVFDSSGASKSRLAVAFVEHNLMKPSPSNPRYRMPAEWEPHASTWLAWPHYRGDWPGKFEPIPWVYAEIIRHLSQHEPIDLIVNAAASEKQARKILAKANAKEARLHFVASRNLSSPAPSRKIRVNLCTCSIKRRKAENNKLPRMLTV